MGTFSLIVGDKSYGREATGLTYSCVDPGGYEACTFTLTGQQIVTRNVPVRVCYGMQTAWEGRVSEVTYDYQDGKSTTTVGCVGWGVLLREQRMSMIYVDRDLNAWTGPSVERKKGLLSVNYGYTDPQITNDEVNGTPIIETGFDGAWALAAKPSSEAWYYSGENNYIGLIDYTVAKNANISVADANWVDAVQINTRDDLTGPNNSSGNLINANPVTGTLTVTGDPKQYIQLLLYYGTGPAGTDNMRYACNWYNIAVWGDHNLPRRSNGGLTGFYASDIVSDVVSRCLGVRAGIIEPADSYIIPHLVYREPVSHEQIITDMGRISGYHWGVWDAPYFGGVPVLDFCAPPTGATCAVARADCGNLQTSYRSESLYNTVHVGYTDVGGRKKTVVINKSIPELENVPAGRVYEIDIGVATQANAEVYGTYILNLLYVQERGAGSATIPATVNNIGGGRRPACLLRAGRDRMRITGLPVAAPLTDGIQGDVYRISRVEVTVNDNGTPNTRVEYDTGSDLLETLQARFQTATEQARV